MKKIITALSIGLIVNSCDFHPLYKENKNVYFSIYNTGRSDYVRMLVYAKDSGRSYADSTPSQGNLGYSEGVALGIALKNLKDIHEGVFEIQAVMTNGKLLRQEFGLINGLDTRLKFKIDLKDSTIYIK
jgi:hypothetical protein